MIEDARRSPQVRHRAHHRQPDLPVDRCWSCQREQALCKSKLRFYTREDVDAWVADFNCSRSPGHPGVVRYPCTWCPGWHFRTARARVDLARIERARRKALRPRG